MPATTHAYTVTMTFSVDETTDPFLQHEQGIVEEAESWLESLRAKVHRVTAHTASRKDMQPDGDMRPEGEKR
jgi:hypothetical protein